MHPSRDGRIAIGPGRSAHSLIEHSCYGATVYVVGRTLSILTEKDLRIKVANILVEIIFNSQAVRIGISGYEILVILLYI